MPYPLHFLSGIPKIIGVGETAISISLAMRNYRLFVYSRDGQAVGPAKAFSAADDDGAIAQAESLRGRLAAELWDFDGLRLVKRLEAMPSQASYPLQSKIDRDMQSGGQA